MNNSIKNLGYYKALNASATQYNSVVFRVVIGFLAHVPGEIIAFVSMIEFSLNFVCEIPFGLIADRFGRGRTALLGHIFIIIGLTSGYFGLIGYKSNYEYSTTAFIFHGIFIGLGKPFLSGSVESFYQSIVEKENISVSEKNNSMTISNKFGKLFTLLSILLAFSIIVVLDNYKFVEHSFALGVILWFLTYKRIKKDYQTSLNKKEYEKKSPKYKKDFLKLKNKKLFFHSVIISSIAFLQMGLIAGYLPVSLGRSELNNRLTLVILFFIASQGLGTYLRGVIVPILISKYSSKVISILLSIGIILSSLCLKFSFEIYVPSLQFILHLVFACLFFICTTTVMNISINSILSSTYKEFTSTALSTSSMPGFILFAILSFYFYKMFSGAPSLEQISFMYILTSTALVLALNFLRTEGKNEK